ncbi:MAG TPA: tetratricopeptide repeat protein [Clostridia bacterium]|nr:tetratricopeptide repeat protein [Clostridia bacterium]
MRLQKTIATLTLATMLVSPLTPAFAANKDIIQLQTQVQALADQMQRMQQSIDERMGIMRNLVEQSTDSINKMSASVTAMQRALEQQNTDTQGRVEQVSGQIQTLNDSVDELKARFAKIQKQMDDMQAAQQAMNMPPQPGPGQPGVFGQPAQQGQNQAPPPDVLYNNALRDYNAGRYDLAAQQFADYVKFYGNTDLAGNAQFYVADVEYRQGNFEAAVRDYDKVLEQFPGGNKAAASQLKKGYALLELGQKDAGVRELNALIQRFPRSLEAQSARDRLRRLGAAATTKPSPSTRRTR